MYAKAVGDLDKVAKSLSAATAQRLVRTLCPECKQAYKPDAAALKKMNLPANRVNELYKASGKVMVDNDEEPCPKCHGIGYIGRTAVFEVLVIDDEARELIRKSDLNGLRSHLRRQKMLYLQETALAKVVAGQTSIREAMRVLDQDKKQAQPAG
jgi:type II secretory ATPase GspE/PulE/Tfp pilus assembly ATPase PilB-like protein